MAGEQPSDHAPTSTPVCRWRTPAETLDVIEALERIEALLLRLEERVRAQAPPEPDREKVRR